MCLIIYFVKSIRDIIIISLDNSYLTDRECNILNHCNYATVCEEGLFGEDCAEVCSCLNGGACDPVDGSCNCTAGYEGTNCAQRM